MSGGSEGAARGTLSVMVGGAPADLERARPVLEAMGRTVTHVGPVGAGQTCKLVNQVLVVVTMLGVSEALLLAEAGGLDVGTALTTSMVFALYRTLQAGGHGAEGNHALVNALERLSGVRVGSLPA